MQMNNLQSPHVRTSPAEAGDEPLKKYLSWISILNISRVIFQPPPFQKSFSTEKLTFIGQMYLERFTSA